MQNRFPNRRPPNVNDLILDEEALFITPVRNAPSRSMRGQATSMSSKVPSSSRLFQFFSAVIFLAVTLGAVMFVRHSTTLSRRFGDVRFPSNKQHRKNSAVLKVVFDEKTNPESYSQMIPKNQKSQKRKMLRTVWSIYWWQRKNDKIRAHLYQHDFRQN